MKESELFEPVRNFLAEEGYAVDAEVHHCDVVGLKGEELVIVELKTSINIKLLVQVADRQKLARQVYVAVPAPARQTRQWRKTAALLKRLGAGLLLVDSSPLGACAKPKFRPKHEGRINKRKRQALVAEFNGRSVRLNKGGVTRQKLATAYRETAICIAALLDKHGPLALKQIRALGGARTNQILQKNHYGWFTRVSRGIYDLTAEGRAGLKAFPAIHRQAKALVAKHSPTD